MNGTSHKIYRMSTLVITIALSLVTILGHTLLPR